MKQSQDVNRGKRAARFSGDYKTKFDLGGSEDDEPDDTIGLKSSRRSSSGKPKRTKECPGCGAPHPLAIKECHFCDYQFTSKSMLVSQQSAAEEALSIREKFPFEPEREEDGSLLIQAILGRRPRKSGKRFLKASGNSTVTAMESKYDHEYLIKYKTLSYLHVKWLTATQIEAMSGKSKSALQRYITKMDRGEAVAEDGDIDSSFIEVEKVLDMREEEVSEVVDDLPTIEKSEQLSNNPLLLSAEQREAEAGLLAAQAALMQQGDSDVSSSLAASQAAAIIGRKFADATDEAIEVTGGGLTYVNEFGEQIMKSASQVFQHVQRCRKVLERIWDDPFGAAFHDPVDTLVYDDYLDIVSEPFCLSDVKKRLEAGEYSKYFGHLKFAQDMRKIWRNCKMYNLYQSQIWYSAHTLSMMFERMFQGWVTSFQDGTIAIDDPIGQPWCSSCRYCQLEQNDEQVMLCDHCDAAYHIYCLRPALPRVPEGCWLCPRCVNWFAKTGAKVLSAAAEEEASHFASGTRTQKIIKTRKKKYLVKWVGLPYRECTWELATDINDDAKIADYHRIHDNPPEEPPLTQAEVGLELAKDRRNPILPALSRPYALQDLDAVLYAQIRTLHFLKWQKFAPDALLRESGPHTHSAVNGVRCPLLLHNTTCQALHTAVKSLVPSAAAAAAASSVSCQMDVANDSGVTKHFRKSAHWYAPVLSTAFGTGARNQVESEVADILSSALYAVARNHQEVRMEVYPSRPKLPPGNCCPSEIEVTLPKGKNPLHLQIGNYLGHLCVLGFRAPVDGEKCPAEACGRIKKGDMLVAIDGIYVNSLTYVQVVSLLKSEQPFMHLRFLRGPAHREGNSLQAFKNYFLTRSIPRDSSIPVPLRSCYFGVYPARLATHCDNESMQWVAEYMDDNYDKCVVGVFEEELAAARAYDSAVRGLDSKRPRSTNFDSADCLKATDNARVLFQAVTKERTITSHRAVHLLGEIKNYKPAVTASAAPAEGSSEIDIAEKKLASAAQEKKEAEEDDMDVASNDPRDSDSELGSYQEERSQHDSDYNSGDESEEEEEEDDDEDEDDDDDDDDGDEMEDSDGEDIDNPRWTPKMKKIAKPPKPAAPKKPVEEEEEDDDDAESEEEVAPEPVEDGPMSRLLRAVNESDLPPIRSDWASYLLDQYAMISPGGPKDASSYAPASRRIDQIDIRSNNVVREWDNVEAAAWALQLPCDSIYKSLKSTTSELAGGFKWNRTALCNDVISEEDEESKRKNDVWIQKLPTKSKEFKNGGTLRDYQVDGLCWLLRCWYTKRSSILADEMGLGKTIQVVSFLEHLYEVECIRGPFLVCVPLSTIQHWRRETEGWTDMAACVYHDTGGGRDMRDIIREFEWYYKNRSRRVLKFQLLITTYDDLIRDYEELAEIPWRVVVVDEAHRMRNVNAKLLECMRTVVAKGMSTYGYQHRILMTGTPLQNNTTELWSLLNFIEPAKFPDLDKFKMRFGNIRTQEQVEALQQRIAPHLLRRVKEDVAKDIPPKEETIIDVELTTMQKQYYRAIFEHNHGFLMQSLKGGAVPKLMNIQMELRKCCNHPFLIHGVEENEMEVIERNMVNAAANQQSGNVVKGFDRKEFERRRMEDVIIPTSGKMVLIDKLLPKLKKEGHKVLIFSQMVKMLDFVEEYCDFRAYSCERLDGRIPGNERQKAIDRFNRSPDSFIFLLSTRAGGVGINLTAADTVIIFDSDWNPQNDIQAMARCHRIGQSKNVTIYRLITRRSFEAEMFERASKKLGLEQALLCSRQFNDATDMGEFNEDVAAGLKKFGESQTKMDAREMEQLLREGAYAVLLEDNSEDIKAFCEQDIDSILEQRAHVMISDAAGAAGGDQLGGGSSDITKPKYKTKKSMFTGDMAMEHAEIDVNDPDFWKKVLPDLVTPDTMLRRFRDDLTADDEDGEEGCVSRSLVGKFMRDLSQMMDGMLDLNRRNLLPEKEREVCMKLLIRMGAREETFEPQEQLMIQDWLAMIEGSRKRGNRAELTKTEKPDMATRLAALSASKPPPPTLTVIMRKGKDGNKLVLRGCGRGKGRGKAAAAIIAAAQARGETVLTINETSGGRKGGKYTSSDEGADDDHELDDDADEDEEEDNGAGDEFEDDFEDDKKAARRKSSSGSGSAVKTKKTSDKDKEKKRKNSSSSSLEDPRLITDNDNDDYDDDDDAAVRARQRRRVSAGAGNSRGGDHDDDDEDDDDFNKRVNSNGKPPKKTAQPQSMPVNTSSARKPPLSDSYQQQQQQQKQQSIAELKNSILLGKSRGGPPTSNQAQGDEEDEEEEVLPDDEDDYYDADLPDFDTNNEETFL